MVTRTTIKEEYRMEAKDTVMGLFQTNTFRNLGRLKTELMTAEERDKAMCLAQAEITWGKAIREVVKWGEGECPHFVIDENGVPIRNKDRHNCDRCWQAFKKENGI